jgi:surface antigen
MRVPAASFDVRAAALGAIAAAALLTAAAVPGPARAQFNPLVQRPADSGGLNKDDIERLNRATERLYTGRSIGTVERWRNPDTGNSGSGKLLKSFKSRGMDCRQMRYRVKLRDSQREPAAYVTNWCRTESGEWKLLEPAPPAGR